MLGNCEGSINQKVSTIWPWSLNKHLQTWYYFQTSWESWLMELVIIMVLMQDTAAMSVHVRILIFVLQFTCNILQPNTAIYKEYLISGPLGVQPWLALRSLQGISPWFLLWQRGNWPGQTPWHLSITFPSWQSADNHLKYSHSTKPELWLSTLAISQYISPLKQTQAALCQLNTNLHIYNFISVL